MNVRLLLFAHLREIVGSSELHLELKAGSNGIDLLDMLQTDYPDIARHRHYIKLSMNGDYIEKETALADQAEIALFPPVSGG